MCYLTNYSFSIDLSIPDGDVQRVVSVEIGLVRFIVQVSLVCAFGGGIVVNYFSNCSSLLLIYV